MLNRRSRFSPDQRSCYGRASASDWMPVQPRKPWVGFMADGAVGGQHAPTPEQRRSRCCRDSGCGVIASVVTERSEESQHLSAPPDIVVPASSLADCGRCSGPGETAPAWLSRVARGYVEIEEPRWHCLCGQFQSYLLHETQGTARHTGVLFTPAIDPRNRQLNFLVACRDTNFTR